MHNLLIEYHREQNTAKRGGGVIHEELNESYSRAVDAWCAPETQYGFKQLEPALASLVKRDPKSAEVLWQAFYLGFTNPQIAETLGLTEANVRRLRRVGLSLVEESIRNNHKD